MTQNERAERRKQIIEYRKQGHTASECATHFNVSKQFVYYACGGIKYPWVADTDTMSKAAKKQAQDRALNEQIAIRMIAKKAHRFEYAGGYTGYDGRVFLKCKICGGLFERSFWSVKQGAVNCPNCQRIKSEAKRTAKEAIRQARLANKLLQQLEEAKKKEEAQEARKHLCPICGLETIRPVYCSEACMKKGTQQKHDMRRRAKILSLLVDTDITLQEVYRRDDGKCYICGGHCDWSDKAEVNGVIVCGNDYPSIDHVKPLAKGGQHSWDNVRLAHRICNTRKSARYSPAIV